MSTDIHGLLERQEDTAGWSTAGVRDLQKPHPDAIVTDDEVDEVLEYMARFHPNLFWDLVKGIPTIQLADEKI